MPIRSLRMMLLTTIGLTAASTLLMRRVHGYGTEFFQVVGLGAFALVDHVTSPGFADGHRAIAWGVMILLNVTLFSVPLIPIWFLFRRRAQAIGSVLIGLWFVFHVACLFVLFPATDGP